MIVATEANLSDALVTAAAELEGAREPVRV